MSEERRIKKYTILSSTNKKMTFYDAQIIETKRTWYGRKKEVWETVWGRCDKRKEIIDFFKHRDFVSKITYENI